MGILKASKWICSRHTLNYSDQFLKSYEEVANLRNNNRKRIDSFNDGMEQTKFVKKGESNSVSVFLMSILRYLDFFLKI